MNSGAPSSAVYKIGAAGWSYPDWKSVFYPSPTPRRFNPLAYYAQFFNLVEVNSSFYRIPAVSHAEKWIRDVARRDDFTFSMKLWRGLTHETPLSLPGREIQAIREVCAVLASAGRFSALLLQFPWSFRHTPRNLDHLQRLFDGFDGFPLAVEIRHAEWIRDEFFERLRLRGVAFCNIDQPRARDCPPPTSIVTAPFSYLRLHGRNQAAWFQEQDDTGRRYDYYYPPAQIEELADLARALAKQTGRTLITANNHFRGQAVADALLLRAELEGRVDQIPAFLAAAYPDLRGVRAAAPIEAEPAAQEDFFGPS